MILEPLSCEAAHAQLSARSDGEPHDAPALSAHLDRCAACRSHERSLALLSARFAGLRANAAPTSDLWTRIERRARPRPAPAWRLRVVAAAAGFIGTFGWTAWLEADAQPAPSRHFLELLAGSTSARIEPGAMPIYRFLQTVPTLDLPR
jgi:predicted anti-sigma-YlaC factor YlaD